MCWIIDTLDYVLWETCWVGAKIFYAAVLATGKEQWWAAIVAEYTVTGSWIGLKVATCDILTIASVCGRISWNNSVSDWPASSLQHCACMSSSPGDWARRSKQALEHYKQTSPSASLVRLISRKTWSIFCSVVKFWSSTKWAELEALTLYALLIAW